jgi:hypothetical protein
MEIRRKQSYKCRKAATGFSDHHVQLFFSLTFWVRRELWKGKNRGTNYTFVVFFPIIHHNHRLATWIVPHTHTHAHNISNKNSHFSQQKWGGLDANTLWYQTTTDGHGSRIHKVVQDLEHMQSLQIHLEDRFWNYVYIYIYYTNICIYIYIRE